MLFMENKFKISKMIQSGFVRNDQIPRVSERMKAISSAWA
jgi:hypothetical protein